MSDFIFLSYGRIKALLFGLRGEINKKGGKRKSATF
jgi:hypothetical protein